MVVSSKGLSDASHVLWPLEPQELGVYPSSRVRLVESMLRRTGADLAESSL